MSDLGEEPFTKEELEELRASILNSRNRVSEAVDSIMEADTDMAWYNMENVLSLFNRRILQGILPLVTECVAILREQGYTSHENRHDFNDLDNWSYVLDYGDGVLVHEDQNQIYVFLLEEDYIFEKREMAPCLIVYAVASHEDAERVARGEAQQDVEGYKPGRHYKDIRDRGWCGRSSGGTDGAVSATQLPYTKCAELNIRCLHRDLVDGD